MVSAPRPPQLAALISAQATPDNASAPSAAPPVPSTQPPADPLHEALTAAVADLLESVDPNESQLQILRAALRLPSLSIKLDIGAADQSVDSMTDNVARLSTLVRALATDSSGADTVEENLQRFVHLQLQSLGGQEDTLRRLVNEIAETVEDRVVVDLVKAVERQLAGRSPSEAELENVLRAFEQSLVRIDEPENAPEKALSALAESARELLKFADSPRVERLAPAVQQSVRALTELVHKLFNEIGERALTQEPARTFPKLDGAWVQVQTADFSGNEALLRAMAQDPSAIPPRETLLHLVQTIERNLGRAAQSEQERMVILLRDFENNLPDENDSKSAEAAVTRLMETIRTLRSEPQTSERGASEKEPVMPRLLRALEVRLQSVLDDLVPSEELPEAVPELQAKSPAAALIAELKKAVTDVRRELQQSIETQEKVRQIVQKLGIELSSPDVPEAPAIERALEQLTQVVTDTPELLPPSFVRAAKTLQFQLSEVTKPPDAETPEGFEAIKRDLVRFLTAVQQSLPELPEPEARPLAEFFADLQKAIGEAKSPAELKQLLRIDPAMKPGENLAVLLREFQQRIGEMIAKFKPELSLPLPDLRAPEQRPPVGAGSERAAPRLETARTEPRFLPAAVAGQGTPTAAPASETASERTVQSLVRALETMKATAVATPNLRAPAAGKSAGDPNFIGLERFLPPTPPTDASAVPRSAVQNDPVSQLIDALKRVEKARSERTGEREQKVFALTKELVAKLEMHREENGTGELSSETKTVLAGVQQGLSEIFGKIPTTVENPLQRAFGDALKSMETLLKGQDALRQMTPLLQAMGEPTFILFPHMIQNMLAKVELAYYPHFVRNEDGAKRLEDNERFPKVDPDEQREKKREKRKPGRHRVQFSLALPMLGELEVDFTHTISELLLTITCALPESGKWIESQLDELEERFESLGYETVMLAARVGAPAVVRPPWVGSLLEDDGIKA